jgi:hypothetical protein
MRITRDKDIYDLIELANCVYQALEADKKICYIR